MFDFLFWSYESDRYFIYKAEVDCMRQSVTTERVGSLYKKNIL